MRASLKVWAAAALLAPLAAFAEEVDGIVARVGTEAVLRSDVLNEMRRIGAPAEAYNDVRNDIIDRKLILRAATESKMSIQDWVVENRIREIVNKAFGGDRNKLMASLQAQKVSYPEWRSRIKDDLVVSAMRWQVVDKYVTASPAAVRAEYDANARNYVTKGKATVEVLLLKPEDTILREQIGEELKKTKFGDLARKYSSDSQAAAGGLWKDICPEETFRPEICKEIAQMPNGTLSHWIEVDGWSFLIRKISATPAGQMSFEDAYDEIVGRVRENEARRIYTEWMTRLRSGTYIRVY